MTQTQKDDWKIAIAFGFAIVAASFVMGVLDGLDKALEAQEAHNRLSVYCQQAGTLDSRCAALTAGD